MNLDAWQYTDIFHDTGVGLEKKKKHNNFHKKKIKNILLYVMKLLIFKILM